MVRTRGCGADQEQHCRNQVAVDGEVAEIADRVELWLADQRQEPGSNGCESEQTEDDPVETDDQPRVHPWESVYPRVSPAINCRWKKRYTARVELQRSALRPPQSRRAATNRSWLRRE